MGIYTETTLVLGDEEGAVAFFEWLDSYSAVQSGWMWLSLCELNPDIATESMHPEQMQSCVDELAGAGLTHAVCYANLQCDDETDLMMEAALHAGLYVVADKRNLTRQTPKFKGRWIAIYENRVAFIDPVSHTPFRLEAWKPLLTSVGAPKDSTNYEAARALFAQPARPQVGPPTQLPPT